MNGSATATVAVRTMTRRLHSLLRQEHIILALVLCAAFLTMTLSSPSLTQSHPADLTEAVVPVVHEITYVRAT